MSLRLLFVVICVLRAALAVQHSGTVKTGEQPVPGVTVTAVQGAVRLSTSTDETGTYSLDLTPGEWTVEVRMFGFRAVSRQLSQADAPSRLEWTLDFETVQPPAPATLRPAFQQVRLNQVAEAPPEPTEIAPALSPSEESASTESFLVNGSLSQGLGAPKEEDLSYLARAFEAERAQSGQGAPGFQSSGGEPARPAVGARRAEGAALLARLSPERRAALMERLRRARPGATARSFGNRRRRGPGIRGQAFYTAGNSAFDARPYSMTGLLFDKPAYAQNRFGLMLGGPLVIPKLVDLSHTFFTLNYNATRNRGPYSAFGIVPSALERSGDFSETRVRGPVTIYDAQSNAPFPGNRIPASRIDSAAAGLLRYLPLANQPGNIQNYQFVTSVPRHTDDLGFRLNQSLSPKNRISGGLSYQRRSGQSPQLLGFLDTTSGKGYTIDLGWSFTLGPRRIHDLRLRVNRDRNETVPFFAYKENVAVLLGIAGPSQNPLNWGPPNLNFTNFADLNSASPLLRRNQNVSLIDSVNLVQGAHTLGAGIEFRWAQINTNADQNARGSFTFSGLLTSLFDERGQPAPGTGFDFADFLLGLPQSSSIRYGSSNTYFRSRIYAAWVQEEWRVRPNLTFNLGARYEYYSPFYEKFGRMANLDIAPGFTGVAVVTPGQAGPWSGLFPRGLVEPDANNLAPRIGFAWRPRAKGRLQVRGGYSQFYDGSTYSNIANRLAAQPPFASTATINTSSARRLTLANGFATSGDSGKKVTNTFAVARDYRVPYAQTWNFSLQTEFGGGLVVEAGYTGTKGTRLDVLRSPNRAAPGSPLTAEQRRLIGNAVGFTFDSSEGNSIFHSAQLRVARRLRRGLSWNATYTLSKSIDNASSIGGAGNVVAQNDKDLAAERGLSVFDQRHNLTLTNIVSSPFGEDAFWLRGKSTLGRILKDWNLATTLTARSGRPFTARVLGNIADAGGTGAVGSGRADATGLPITGGFGFFNPLAFTTPPPGRFGNAGRNTIPGPSFAALNVSFGRTFNLSDRRRLELRVQSENATNHVNFTGIGTVVNATNYGLATSAGTMRTVHLTARFRF